MPPMHGAFENMIIIAERRARLDDHVPIRDAVVAHGDVRFDDREGPDRDFVP